MSLPSAQLRGGSLRTSYQTSFWFQGVVGLAVTGLGWGEAGLVVAPDALGCTALSSRTPNSHLTGSRCRDRGRERQPEKPGLLPYCHHHCRPLGVLCIWGCVSRGLRSLASRSAASAKAEDAQLGSAARSYVAATQLRCNGLRIPDLQLSITFLGRVH